MKKGYVALTTVLIILPLLLLTGVDSLYKNITSLIIGRMNYDSQILRSNSETCLEEAVYRIKRRREDPFLYQGNGWQCDVIIEDKVGFTGVKIITVVATDDSGIGITSVKELNINTDPFELSNI